MNAHIKPTDLRVIDESGNVLPRIIGLDELADHSLYLNDEIAEVRERNYLSAKIREP